MKRQVYPLLLITTVVFFSCSSGARSRESSTVTPSGPLFEGDGGRDIRLAIFAPVSQGDVPSYLPSYVLGRLNDNFRTGRYSNITLTEQQFRNWTIEEQRIIGDVLRGHYSDLNRISPGNFTNANYYLFVSIQRLAGDLYSFQFRIIDPNTNTNKAFSMKDGTLMQNNLDSVVYLINAATADLLNQVGVRLTAEGRKMLLAGNLEKPKPPKNTANSSKNNWRNVLQIVLGGGVTIGLLTWLFISGNTPSEAPSY